MADTQYASFHRIVTHTTNGEFYDKRNLVILSRFPIQQTEIIRDSDGPQPSYKMVTAVPEDITANELSWERPLLYVQIDLGQGHILHLINVHLKSKLASNIPGQKANNYT